MEEVNQCFSTSVVVLEVEVFVGSMCTRTWLVQAATQDLATNSLEECLRHRQRAARTDRNGRLPESRNKRAPLPRYCDGPAEPATQHPRGEHSRGRQASSVSARKPRMPKRPRRGLGWE